MFTKLLSLFTGLLIMNLMNQFSQAADFKASSFDLAFGTDGRPSSIKRADGVECLNMQSPGEGFSMAEGSNRAEAGSSIRFSKLSVQPDGKLLATTEDGSKGILFNVKSSHKYISFRIESLQGIPADTTGTLAFQMNANPSVRVMELDYMTSIRQGDEGVTVSWPDLRYSGSENPYGGFALYCANGPEDEDDTILRIWAGENLPHPKVTGQWDLNAAQKLVADWQERYGNQSQMYLEAKSLKELYEEVKYAERAKVRDVYLFTNTWSGAGDFWPNDGLNWDVRKSVFPKGEEDLRAFADYLESKGIHLKQHWVSGGIGMHDPRYVTPKPDHRLAAQVTGQLAQAASADDTTLTFMPAPGYKAPQPRARAGRRPRRDRGSLPQVVRIGDELVKVGSYKDMDKPVWQLSSCERGFLNTQSVSHEAGAESAILVSPYNAVFVPDIDSTLMDEIAEGYAGLVNRCHISNVEFDGLEVHSYKGSWGCEKFAAKVYAALDHPVSSNTSGGRAPNCWIEYRLNSTKRIMRGNAASTHGGYSAAIMLEEPSRPASNMLDTNFSLGKAAANGSNRFSITKPQPMFGVTLDTLRNHGLTDKIIETVKNWREASAQMTDAQRETMRATLKPAKRPLPDSSGDPSSEVVWVLRDGWRKWSIVPVTVMKRKEGDIDWHSWQEHGPISPRQFIKAGEKMTLMNPNMAQTPRAIIHVLYAFNPDEAAMAQTVTEPLKDVKWVWSDPAEAKKNLYMRAEFNIPKEEGLAHARFHFAGADRLTLWINGKRVDEGGARNNVTSWDVERYVQPGRNIIAIEAVRNGDKPAIAARIEAAAALDINAEIEAGKAAAFEGKTVSAKIVALGTGKDWKCSSVADEGWQNERFDDSKWRAATELAAMGDPAYGSPKAADEGNILLQPKAADMQGDEDTVFEDVATGLQITQENADDQEVDASIPYFQKQMDMNNHRGIGMTVTGDGSNSVLLFQIPGRDYVTPINFKGARYIEIPNGEVSWADGRWGWRTSTHRSDYGRIDRAHLGFGRVPSGARASVKVEGLKALKEIPAELKNPVIHVGEGALSVKGSIYSGEYLEYDDEHAIAYDRNWNKLRELKVKAANFTMPGGESEVSIENSDKLPVLWLDVQFMTDGEAIVVPK